MFFSVCFPKLLNMSLTASVVIVFVLLLRLFLKKAPKIISYALWGLVLFRLLCPISLESGLSLFGLVNAPVTPSGTLTSSIEYIPGDLVQAESPSVVLPAPDAEESILQGVEQPVSGAAETPVVFAAYIWVTGVLGMGLYGVLSYLRLRRKLVTASPLRENIYLVDEISSPFVLGLLHPKIYLPSSLGVRELPYIVMHEQHHIRRLDHLVKVLAFVALSIHWFNPLVWLAFVLSARDMEMSCDEAVIRKMGDGIRADYTASLLSLATGKHIIAGMPLAFGEGDTKGRIRNLANRKKPAFWMVLVGVVICTVAALGLLTNPTAPVDEQLAVFLDGQIAAHHQSEYSKENFCCLDWEVLGTEKRGNQVTAYLWVLYREYSDAVTVESGAHIPTVITAELQNGNYIPVEYWEPRDGSYYAQDIRSKFPLLLQGKAMDSQRYIKKQSDTLDQAARDHFAQMGTDTAEVLSSTTYVSNQCIYLNPLSSYAPINGDSGYIYRISGKYFEMISRSTGVPHLTQVSNWEWQPFPYTEEEWAALFTPATNALANLHELYNEIQYLPLTANHFFMRVDGQLWIVELASNPQMGTYLWSIYHLVPQSQTPAV